jgi:hypothetical protein
MNTPHYEQIDLDLQINVIRTAQSSEHEPAFTGIQACSELF